MIALPQLSTEIMLCYHFGLKLTGMIHTHSRSQALGSDIFLSNISIEFYKWIIFEGCTTLGERVAGYEIFLQNNSIA